MFMQFEFIELTLSSYNAIIQYSFFFFFFKLMAHDIVSRRD